VSGKRLAISEKLRAARSRGDACMHRPFSYLPNRVENRAELALPVATRYLSEGGRSKLCRYLLCCRRYTKSRRNNLLVFASPTANGQKLVLVLLLDFTSL